MQFAIEITWTVCALLVKCSVLLLYDRIFSRTSPRFRILLMATTGIIFAWAVGSVCSTLFRCSPVKFFWNKDINGSCSNAKTGRIAAAALNSAIDVILLVLPVPLVWKLMLPSKQKLAVIGIFGLGIL